MKLRRSQDDFWRSSLAHILKMLDIYVDEMMVQASGMKNEEYHSKYFNEQPEVVDIKSMKDIPGW
jgi:hypothetical protein